jgi:ATP-dependent helicase/nuclease subunit A
MRSKKYELSSEQSAAIDIRKNISVSAGAGSGKTRVLTTRYLKLLESGYEIEDIAAITFTEKAALEMKQRIREAIIVEMTLSGDDERQMWIRHLDGLGRSSISTIHGFCSNLVRKMQHCWEWILTLR